MLAQVAPHSASSLDGALGRPDMQSLHAQPHGIPTKPVAHVNMFTKHT
jgi:hypothetical protein